MYSFKGKNPTKLYFDAVNTLVNEGDTCSPRGKLIKELRPASVEFENPYNRVTFLGSRRINPFFQIAESLWILSGRADVDWLVQFNANMSQFSDDGKWFNAPYGERIRSWNKNALHNVIINPIDQMMDAYTKLLADKDTRQAVIVISNPMFDNSKYTIGEQGKDIACNLVITFKIRHDKLNMTVFNRSNDAHWGLWGANLCQFTTIQETMLSWLKNSGDEQFVNLEIGTYCQLTDSLHIYLDDYGAKCTTDVLDYYKKHDSSEVEADFSCKSEPRMSLSAKKFDSFLSVFWTVINPYLSSDTHMENTEQVAELCELVSSFYINKVLDEYWLFGIQAMIAYRLVKLNNLTMAMKIISNLPACQWKISMLYFLKNFIYKVGKDESRMDEYNDLVQKYQENVENIQNNMIHPEYNKELETYLKL